MYTYEQRMAAVKLYIKYYHKGRFGSEELNCLLFVETA